MIVPIYNTGKYLRDCINSALNQTYDKIEIILIDDGSTDSSPSICDEFSNEYINIRVFHKENGGQSSARNKGIEISKGEYIVFLDSDDCLKNDAVEVLVNASVINDADVVMPDRYIQVDENGNQKLLFHFDESMLITNPVEFAVNVIVGKGRGWRSHSMIFRSKVIKTNNIKFEEGYIAEDMMFNLECMNFINKVAFYYGNTVYYLKRSKSTTTSFHKEFYENYLFMDKKVKYFLVKNGLNNKNGENKRRMLFCRNIISYIFDIFSKKNDYSFSKRKEIAKIVLISENVKKNFIDKRIDLYFNSKLIIFYYKLMHFLVRHNFFQLVYVLSTIAGKMKG